MLQQVLSDCYGVILWQRRLPLLASHFLQTKCHSQISEIKQVAEVSKSDRTRCDTCSNVYQDLQN
jgi:hypothetical protein